mmetsp:Transcript_2581/g.7033  ORF Transcript_2581/g.7033 Transcript_2581/m.7033 type:complete len:85 (-) Transcript_2581:24-278(-)
MQLRWMILSPFVSLFESSITYRPAILQQSTPVAARKPASMNDSNLAGHHTLVHWTSIFQPTESATSQLTELFQLFIIDAERTRT